MAADVKLTPAVQAPRTPHLPRLWCRQKGAHCRSGAANVKFITWHRRSRLRLHDGTLRLYEGSLRLYVGNAAYALLKINALKYHILQAAVTLNVDFV